MAKLRPSLDAFANAVPAEEAPALHQPAEAPGRVSAPPAEPAKARRDRPHTTLYLDKATQRTIKEIALQYDRKVHDLYLEGINMMLRHYGKPPIEGQGRG